MSSKQLSNSRRTRSLQDQTKQNADSLGQYGNMQTLGNLHQRLDIRNTATYMEGPVMIPILTKNNYPKEAGTSSYRPINLTICVKKTIERVVNQRLKWYLETNNLLATQQAGFRQFRSTENQTTYLSQEIGDAFQEENIVQTARIDLQRAFHNVWTDGLLVKLMRGGVSGHMLKWIKSYLRSRRIRVSFDQVKSRKLRHGFPHGRVL